MIGRSRESGERLGAAAVSPGPLPAGTRRGSCRARARFAV